MQMVSVSGNVEPAFGSQLLALFGHQTAIARAYAAGDTEHLLGGGHFEVHPSLQGIREHPHVAVLDVSAVFAQVECNGVRPGLLGNQGRLDWLRIAGTSSLAQGRHVVDVYAKEDWFVCAHLSCLHQPLSRALIRREQRRALFYPMLTALA
jgi:hypothetical protein